MEQHLGELVAIRNEIKQENDYLKVTIREAHAAIKDVKAVLKAADIFKRDLERYVDSGMAALVSDRLDSMEAHVDSEMSRRAAELREVLERITQPLKDIMDPL